MPGCYLLVAMVKIKSQTVRALPSGELRTAYCSTPELIPFIFPQNFNTNCLCYLMVQNITEKFNPVNMQQRHRRQTIDRRKCDDIR